MKSSEVKDLNFLYPLLHFPLLFNKYMNVLSLIYLFLFSFYFILDKKI